MTWKSGKSTESCPTRPQPRRATSAFSTTPVRIISTRLTISSSLNCHEKRGVRGLSHAQALVGDGDRRTSRSSGPRLALLAPAADRAVRRIGAPSTAFAVGFGYPGRAT